MDFALRNPAINTFFPHLSSTSDIEKENIGDEVQKLSVIRDLLPLIQADEQGCMQRVIPKILQALGNATTEFHIETAKAFSTLLEKKAVSAASFAQSFLPAIIFHVDNRDQVVSNAWLEALLNATELLPLEIVKNHIFAVAINKGQISQNVFHRLAACQLLGKIGSRFDSHVVKKDILPVVLSLCQDVNESVRACICSQLHLIAKGVPPDMIKSALIPILVELGRDETIQVRVEAIETIVKIIPFVNQDLLKSTIIPLIKKICEQAFVALDDTLVKVAKQFGNLCINLENVLSQSEKLWMVTYYHNLSHLDIPAHGPKKDVFYNSHNTDRANAKYSECRQFCAYNFPAMAKFCASKPELLEQIYPSFCDFSTDPYYMVRKTIGASMHEVAKILSTNNRVVKNQVMTLLWDNMEEVLMGVVPNLGTTIECLISSGVLGHDQDGVSYELGRGLLQCDKTIREKTHNWRLYSDFITQLEIIVKCLPSDYIYSHFVSLMFDKMHRARPLPCRLAAAKTLLIFLRFNLKNNQRQEIRSRLQSEFCLSSSCYKRMLYLRLCNTAREVFSRSYFKEHFFYPLLSRSEDKVPNNRLILIRQFPFLKAMIIMPSEKKYLQTLETCVRSMAISEKDKDVTAELKAIIHKMDKTETLPENTTNPTPDDLEDRKKQEEEVKVANSAMRAGNIVPTPADGKKAQKDLKHKPNGQRPNITAGGPSSSTAPSSNVRQPYPSVASSYNSISSQGSYSPAGSVHGKSFEEDFYRDAGIKANDVISKKFSGIPICEKPPPPQISTPKISTSVANKRRTWFGNENSNHNSVKLETITGFKGKSFEKKKSETLPARENISLKKLGIGPRSKSFILPSTLVYSDKEPSNFQSTKLIFDKGNEKTKAKTDLRNNSNSGSCSDSEANRFGFRSKKLDSSLKNEEKVEDLAGRTKIPLGRIVNGTSPAVSSSTIVTQTKNKFDGSLRAQTNGTKKIPMVVSRKSMLIQSNSVKNEIKNKRRSLDPTKISLANLDKGVAYKKKNDKVLGKTKNGINFSGGVEEQGDKDPAASATSSKLPVRKPKSDK